jgi:drug/metabolite transporter (DMT)-like permease
MLLFAVQFGALYIALAAGMSAATTALIACSSPVAVAALSAWPILGTPVGPTALMGFVVATCGLRLASVSHERQVGDPDAADHRSAPNRDVHWMIYGSGSR